MSRQVVVGSQDSTLSRRQAIAIGWIEAATRLASESADPEAVAVADFLKMRAEVAVPMIGEDIAVGQPPHNGLGEKVYLVPMLSEDVWRLHSASSWPLRHAGYGSDGDLAYASFLPSTRAIYLPGEWRLSDLCKGMLLLHEGLHAYDRIVRRRHMPKPRLRREYNAWSLEARLFGAHGERTLRDYLHSILGDVEEQYGATSKKEQFHYWPSKGLIDDAILTEIAARPRGRDDRNYLTGRVAYCAVESFFVQQYGPRRTKLLMQMYVENILRLMNWGEPRLQADKATPVRRPPNARPWWSRWVV